jgi:hypothetical protein
MEKPTSGISRIVPFSTSTPEEVFHITGVGIVHEESPGNWTVISTGEAMADILSLLVGRGDLAVASYDPMGAQLCATWPDCESLVAADQISQWREILLSKYILHKRDGECLNVACYEGLVFECAF